MSHRIRRRAVLGLRLLAGVLAMLGGALLAFGFVQQREPDGYLTSPAAELSTSTRAMTTTEVEVATGRTADPSIDVGDLARVRIRATSTDNPAPFFLGIARTSDVETYLREVDHDQMTALRTDPPGLTFHREPGPGTPAAPADQPFWEAAAVSSGGVATLEWDKRGGTWSAVAMPTDGSEGLSLQADVGLRFAFLLPLGTVLLATGAGCAIASLAAGPRAGRDRVRQLLPQNRTETGTLSQDSASAPTAAARRPG